MTPRDARAALPKGLEAPLAAYEYAVGEMREPHDTPLSECGPRLEAARATLVTAILSYGVSERGGVERAVKVLEFYANPETYAAIGMFPDPPCGDFVRDFDVPGDEWDRGIGFDVSVPRPGRLARAALRALAAGPGGEGGANGD